MQKAENMIRTANYIIVMTCACLLGTILLSCVQKAYFEDSPKMIEAFALTHSDYYSHPPLRVGTVGQTLYHRPFCPQAKAELAAYGSTQRVDYWDKKDVRASGRKPDAYCCAGEFDFDKTPQAFAAGEDDLRVERVLPSPQLRSENMLLCNLQRYTAVFVSAPEECVSGRVRPGSQVCLLGINAIHNQMGDANRDGDCDIEDYPFFQACYKGSSVEVSLNCQYAFDYDRDSDVDDADFTKFHESMYSGNTYWACKYFALTPDTVMQPHYEIPLRIGVEGTNYYHRIDCPTLQALLSSGPEKRIDYYTWDQIYAARLLPALSDNTNVCDARRSSPNAPPDNCLDKKDTCPVDPMSGPCSQIQSAYDLDRDGDVDLHDFATAQINQRWRPID